MTSAIEHTFPSRELGVLAELESWRKEVNRPTYHMHKWWATRLGSVFRAILIGALSDKDHNIWDEFYRSTSFPGKVVYDPFMGSGTTIGEALKLGCHVIGADINPVSVFQVRKALEPVRIDELQQAFATVEAKVKHRIQAMYQSLDPETGCPADILYCFWVMTVLCPQCTASVDLFDTSIFAKNACPQKVPVARSVCFSCGCVNTTRYDATHLHCSGCSRAYNPQAGVVNRDVAVCSRCKAHFKIINAIEKVETIPAYHLYALFILTSQGEKKYIQATDTDRQKIARAQEQLQRQPMLLPATGIEPGHNTKQVLRYHYTEWRQFFNARQQYCLSLLLQAILEEPDESCRELLLLLFSGTLEFNTMFCSYKGEGTGAVRHLFNHHILKPERMALENAVWGTPKSSGCFSTLFESRLLPALRYRQRPFELKVVQRDGKKIGEKVFGLSSSPVGSLLNNVHEFDRNNRIFLCCADSAHVDVPDASVDAVVTDPPYFDFVHYSELADFFYTWLRLGLRNTYPEFQRETTRNAREVQQRDANLFSTALSNVFTECRRVLKPQGVLVLSFHHSRNDGWAAVGAAILNAGLRVVASHPIKAEMAGASPKSQTGAPITYDAILVCKRREESTRALVVDAVNATMEGAKNKMLVVSPENEHAKLSKGDLFVITQAEALCHFSRHADSLFDSSGAKVSLSAFLTLTAARLCDGAGEA